MFPHGCSHTHIDWIMNRPINAGITKGQVLSFFTPIHIAFVEREEKKGFARKKDSWWGILNIFPLLATSVIWKNKSCYVKWFRNIVLPTQFWYMNYFMRSVIFKGNTTRYHNNWEKMQHFQNKRPYEYVK